MIRLKKDLMTRIPNTKYNLGDRVRIEGYSNFELECSAAGTTSMELTLNIEGVVNGTKLEDGSVIWTVRIEVHDANAVVRDSDGNLSIIKINSGGSINGVIAENGMDRNNFCVCETPGNLPVKIVESGQIRLTSGAEIVVKFINENTASDISINVNGSGAHPILFEGSPIPFSFIRRNGIYAFRFSGTAYEFVGNITRIEDMSGSTIETDGSGGLVPAPSKGNTNRFLRCDGEWKTPEVPVFKGATTESNGAPGLVPAPEKNVSIRYLASSGAWSVPNTVFKGATTDKNGESGLVPSPEKGDNERYLRSDGQWETPTGTQYEVFEKATASSNGASGLVPAPVKGKQSSLLRGDGVWVDKATTAVATAGIDDEVYMTPLKTKQMMESQKSGSILVGDVMYRPYLASGFVKANGATVKRTAYPDLVKFISEHDLWTTDPKNNPWKYGIGDGSTTMVLPDYRNRTIWGGDSAGELQAGLPNITGTFCIRNNEGYRANNNPPTGVFKEVKRGMRSEGNADDNSLDKIYDFNASRSSAVYGKSSTVQPPAIQLIPQIKY